MSQKLTADQVRQVEEIEDFQRAADRLKHLVTELEANRAGQTRTIQHLCEKIAIEASQMRQRALTGNVGTVADVAGGMSVMAGRGGGVLMKIRALGGAVDKMQIQLDAGLKHALMPPEPEKPALACPPSPAPALANGMGTGWAAPGPI